MDLLRVFIWSAVQGLTEFIPVSSSGHLVILPRIIGMAAPNMAFNIALHAGTLIAVIIFFRKDLIALFTTERRRGAITLAATLPIFVFGLLFADRLQPFFEDPGIVGWSLVINGIILFFGHLRLRRNRETALLNMPRGVLIGLAQSLALFPGISRSGITIITGTYAGLKKEEAYRFSFLLFVPAAILAFLYCFKDGASMNADAFNIEIFIAIVASAGFGIFALKILYALLTRSRFHILALYCIGLGLLTIYLF